MLHQKNPRESQSGFSAPLFTIANNFNMGINTGASVGAPFASSSTNSDFNIDYSFVLSAPFYLTLGYGPGTKKGNTRKIGFKAGVGYQLTNSLIPNFEDVIYSYVHPQMMAEITFNFKKESMFSRLKIRYERQLAEWPQKGYYDVTANSEGISFMQQSVSLALICSKKVRKETLMYDLGN